MAIQIPYTDGIVTPPGVSNVESQNNKGQANGYAPLDSNAKVPVANLPDQASLDAEVDGKISAHNSATLNVHGIVDTENLTTHAVAIQFINDHNAETQLVHGIADTANLIHSSNNGANVDKAVTFQSGTIDSEIGAWGLGVEDQGGNWATVEPNGVNLNNGAKLQKGTTDGLLGGNKGIALKCSADYELKWEAGRLYTLQQDGATIRSVEHCLTEPTSSDDDTKGFVVGSRWIMDNGDVYVCADGSEANAIWNLKFSQANENNNGGFINTRGYSESTGGYIDTHAVDGSSGGYIKTCAYDGGGTDGGFIDTSGGENGVGGSINTCNGGGYINTSGGGSIDTSNGGGNISTRGGDSYDNLNGGLGGSIILNGENAQPLNFFVPSNSGSINLSGGESGNGGSINASNRGGDLILRGGEGFNREVLGGKGGTINTSGGNWYYGFPSTLEDPTNGRNGGNIDTSDGGGSISTRGTGSIQLGNDGTRTTLYGSASVSNKTITLPNATGTVSLVGHTHTIANVTGLQTELDGKQASGSYAPATGISPTAITGTAVITTDSRLSDARTPTAHAHGSITNAGAIGSTANLPLITTTSGVVTTGSFGTTANTFCQGNDVRLGAKTILTLCGDGNVAMANSGSYVYGCFPTRPQRASGSYDIVGLKVVGNWTITGLAVHHHLPQGASATLTYKVVKITGASATTDITSGLVVGGNNNLNYASASGLSNNISDGDVIGLMLTLGATGTIPSGTMTVNAQLYCVPR